MIYIFRFLDRLTYSLIVLLFGGAFVVLIPIFLCICFLWDFKWHYKDLEVLIDVIYEIPDAFLLKNKITDIFKRIDMNP